MLQMVNIEGEPFLSLPFTGLDGTTLNASVYNRRNDVSKIACCARHPVPL